MTLNRAAVLGSPISHSLSPALHRAAYAELGLDDWSYEAIEHDAESFPAWFAGLDESWRGLSLTMPLKDVAAQLADRLSPSAELTGAVNTITWVEQGSRRTAVGDNTDVHGVVAALQSAGVQKAETACVLGAGATARSAVVALSQLGVQRVTLLSRSRERTGSVLDLAAGLGLTAVYAPLRRLDLLSGADVVIAALPFGVADRFAASLRDGGLDFDPFAGTAGVLLDVVYQSWPTPLGAAWQSAGGVPVSGLEMLLHQAAAQVQLMTGLEPPIDAMRAAVQS